MGSLAGGHAHPVGTPGSRLRSCCLGLAGGTMLLASAASPPPVMAESPGVQQPPAAALQAFPLTFDSEIVRLYVEGANRRAQRIYERLAMRLSAYKIFEMDFRAGFRH